MNRSRYDWLLIAVFLAAITAPSVRQFTGGAASTEAREKRKLAPLPAWPTTQAAVWQFPKQFTAYETDHFGYRSDLIRLHALLLYRGLGLSPSGFVLAGRDGWLYYADDYSLEDFHSARRFTTAELERWREVLEQRQAWLATHGCRLLVVFPCDKYIIYPEYLPAAYRRPTVPYRVDELTDYLRRHSAVPVVALHEALLEAKPHDRLYHRTDTHWNDRGTHVGYREIITRLGLTPLPLEAFEPVNVTTEGWDLARMMGLEDIAHEEDRQLVPRAPRRARVVDRDRPDRLWNNGRVVLEVDAPSLPRLVVFRDSFGSALVPFLAEHFRRSVFLWQYDFDPQVIDREKPDVVIWLITSRRLQWYEPVNPPLPE
jgi:hypothetical protein